MLLQDKKSFIEGKKGVPDLLFSLGERSKGVLPSNSVSVAESVWFDTDGTKAKQNTCLITLLSLSKVWPKLLVIPTYLAVQNKKINLFSLLGKKIGNFCASLIPVAKMSVILCRR